MSTAAFIHELRADARFAGSSVADDLETILEAMDFQGDDNADAADFHRAVSWIMAQPDSIEKRLGAISRLIALGKVEDLSLRQFYAPT
jgi:hypothetical protein